MKRSTLSLLAGVFLAAGLFGVQPANANDFPNKPVSILVPWGPGGPADLFARGLIEQGAALLKQPIVILNKPGASGTLGSSEIFRAKPDGYSLLLADSISTVFQPKRLALPYRGYEDFQAIVKLTDVPNILAVSANSKWKTLNDFVADARNRPGLLRVATAGRYTATDLNILEFNRIAGIDLATIPSSGGTGQAMTMVLGNHVEAIIASPASIVGHVSSQTLRPLAVFSNKRIGLFPEVPSTVELGYNTTMTNMFYVSAPKNLDPVAMKRLSETFLEVVKSPKWKEMSEKFGLLLEPLGPQELTASLEAWNKYFVKFNRDLNIQPEK